MLQSRVFTTTRDVPKDEEAKNAQLLVRAGYVSKLMAGVYSYLPLGLRVLRNVEQIVREEMNALGAEEILMPTLHPKAPWETTGAWDKVDVLFKIKSRTENEYALGQSEEEIVSPLVLSRAQSYKQYPVKVYQIGWKYRDELRAKSGLMRGREFLMKDMYSFHTTQEDFAKFYEEAKKAYLRIYSRLGLVAKATEAGGGSFSDKISYEFMVLTDAGEDDILYCETCDYCVNVEISKFKEGEECPRGDGGKLKAARASEVGNIFDLGQKYGKDFDLGYVDAEGKKQFPIMGCYGIGISRVMGVIAEKYNDEHGMIWPEAVAPYQFHIVPLFGKDDTANAAVESAVKELTDAFMKAGEGVLVDDRRDVGAGEKFADSDLIGIPHRIVVSAKTVAAGAFEVKHRADGKVESLDLQNILKIIAK